MMVICAGERFKSKKNKFSLEPTLKCAFDVHQNITSYIQTKLCVLGHFRLKITSYRRFASQSPLLWETWEDPQPKLFSLVGYLAF